MAGPWPLTSLFRAMARHSLMVQWADVTSYSLDRIEIRTRRSELRSVLDGDESDNGSGDEKELS